ncbi:MAG TPA: polysaccharide deacetylase family protein [Candidatus Saccharimonadales bacterium]|nr:polysaccharide deacetylase family protein [Candidatus Saccharimonadales bacterium]
MKRSVTLIAVGLALIGLTAISTSAIKNSNKNDQISTSNPVPTHSKQAIEAEKNSVLGENLNNGSDDSKKVAYNTSSQTNSRISKPSVPSFTAPTPPNPFINPPVTTPPVPTPSPTPTPTPTPVPTPASNLIVNPSVEDSTNGQPNSWNAAFYGNNTSALTYENTGHTGSRSLKNTISAWTDGASDWFFAPVNVTPGQAYKYSEWYKSDVNSEINAAVTFADGTVSYYIVKQAPASSDWTQLSATFTVPANGVSISIYHILAKAGTVQNDDFSFTTYSPTGFNRALISLTFDDGTLSQILSGLPLLDQYGMKATFYVMSGTVQDHDNYPGNMSLANLQTLVAGGHEIGAHTIDHTDLTTLTAAQLSNQLSQPKSDLQNWLSTNVTDFASPYGAYNPTVIAAIKQYYASHRSVEEGLNSKDNFDIYNIKVRNILGTTTPAEVQAWVNEAAASKSWLVIVYHEVGPAIVDPADPSTTQYNVLPADLAAELAIIQQSGIAVLPVNQALAELTPQL